MRPIVAQMLAIAAAGISMLALVAADTPPVPPVATKFLQLFQDLRDAEAAKSAGKYRHVSFQISSTEVNDYLKYALQATPRPGLQSVNIKIFQKNYISTVTLVDFDAVERWKPGTIPWLLRPVLSG